MLKSMSVLVAHIVLIGCASGSVGGSEPSPGPTDICAVMANPDQMVGRTISTRARIFTDHFEFTGVTGEACAPEWLPFGIFSSRPSGLRELEEAIESVRGNSEARVITTVTGEIREQPGRIPEFVLIPKSFSDIVITTE